MVKRNTNRTIIETVFLTSLVSKPHKNRIIILKLNLFFYTHFVYLPDIVSIMLPQSIIEAPKYYTNNLVLHFKISSNFDLDMVAFKNILITVLLGVQILFSLSEHHLVFKELDEKFEEVEELKDGEERKNKIGQFYFFKDFGNSAIQNTTLFCENRFNKRVWYFSALSWSKTNHTPLYIVFCTLKIPFKLV